MPELPEVESVRRGLQRARLREPVVSVWRSDKALRVGVQWAREELHRLPGQRPVAVERRGKFLVWRFAGDGDEPTGLLVHLGMTGKLLLARPGDPALPHTHLVLRFADQREVRFVDPRRFGGLRAAPLSVLRAEPPLCELGPEPFDRAFGGAWLETVAGRSHRAVRDVLLDQSVVAGVGNIYAVEALFYAGIHPLVAARRLRRSAWDRLAAKLIEVLEQGIRNGGTTFRDFRTTTGRTGKNQARLMVYGRAGQPCRACGTRLESFTHHARSGAFCPRHQPRPRGRIA